MEQSTKRTLASIVIGMYLFAACASAQAATQDSALVQQVIEQSVALTSAAGLAQAKDGQLTEQSAALTALAQSTEVNGQPVVGTSTPPPTVTPQTTPAALLWTITPSTTPSSLDDCRHLYRSQLLSIPAQVTILKTVNFRTSPGLSSQSLLTLQPGMEVEVIGGPVRVKLRDAREYLWWQIKLPDPDGRIGWSAEISACGEYYFMEPK